MKEMYKNNLFWLAIAIVVFLVNQLVNIVDMCPVGYDEAWYGNTAYNFAHGNGFLNTVAGSRGNANFVFPMIVGTFMKIFGYNLLSIRLAAVFCGVLTLFFIFLSLQQLKVNWQAYPLVFLFFVSISIYNWTFRDGRPEGAALMFQAAGIWMYLRYKESHSWLDILGLSIFTYFATCAHPNVLLIFALMGACLLIEVVKTKNWRQLTHLMVLLFFAIAAIASIAWVSYQYNAPGENYFTERFSIKNVAISIPVYLKFAFFAKKHVLYVVPLLCMLAYLSLREGENREMAISTLIYFILFPILYSTDESMVIFGVDYVILTAIILMASFWETLGYKKKWICVFTVYCIVNLGVSYYYNYAIRYETTNTILMQDLQRIIPKGAKVFGPIRQWPMIMETDYKSDHAYYSIGKHNDYDYIILNSQDTPRYQIYENILPINSEIMSLIYKKETKQYGMIQVYRNTKKD